MEVEVNLRDRRTFDISTLVLLYFLEVVVTLYILTPFLFTRYTFHHGKFHITCYTSFLGNKLSLSLSSHMGPFSFLLSTSLFSKNCLKVREMRSVTSKKNGWSIWKHDLNCGLNSLAGRLLAWNWNHFTG